MSKPTDLTQIPDLREPQARNDESASLLQWICSSVLQTSFPFFRNARIDARFYPYIGLTHTIRRKGTGWIVRISDHCRRAPRPVLEAIVMILGSKIMRRKTPGKYLETYDLFRKDPDLEERVRGRRRASGRKQIGGVQGEHYSLEQIYNGVNAQFFNSQIEIQKIGWSLRKGWRRLGHYDPIHHTITLSPALDSAKVPQFVVHYIVYHEMLHAVFGEAASTPSRRHHPPEFQRAERAYPDYERAKKFLREYFGKRHRSIDN
jgi:hypothetical protein